MGSRGPFTIKCTKMMPKWSGFGLDWGPFGVHFGIFWELFFDVFYGCFFFASWASFGCPRVPKGCQTESQSQENCVLKPPCGTCKKHGRHGAEATWGGPRGVPGTTFFKTGLQTLSEGVLGGFFEILRDLGCPLGSPGKLFWRKKRKQNLIRFGVEIPPCFWRGRRKGRGPCRSKILQILTGV